MRMVELVDSALQPAQLRIMRLHEVAGVCTILDRMTSTRVSEAG